jgi:hypothetical protein
MRRLPSASAKSHYVSNLENMSFKRERITISQVRSTGARPGAAVLFCFGDIETNKLIPGSILAWVNGDSYEPSVIPTTSSFHCRGGLIQFLHSCSTCSRKFYPSCGTRERNRELWCHSVGPEYIEGLSERDIYLYDEQVSARYNDRSQMNAVCGGWALAVVRRAQEDGNPNSIRVRFKTRLDMADSYFIV